MKRDDVLKAISEENQRYRALLNGMVNAAKPTKDNSLIHEIQITKALLDEIIAQIRGPQPSPKAKEEK